ncbi:MAG: hypothetical protein GF350_17315 [Chitinivibrionales bacterium]|nr:hypothetical protein [Chitinivibrionales bacterium]
MKFSIIFKTALLFFLFYNYYYPEKTTYAGDLTGGKTVVECEKNNDEFIDSSETA